MCRSSQEKTSAGFDEAVTALPRLFEMGPDAGAFRLGVFRFPALLIARVNKPLGFALGELEQLAIAQKIGYAKVGETGLTGAEEFAGTAHGEVEFGQLESILGADHGIQPLFGKG